MRTAAGGWRARRRRSVPGSRATRRSDRSSPAAPAAAGTTSPSRRSRQVWSQRPTSARDLERELRRAAARDERCDLVPVDEAGERLSEDARQAEAAQLLGAPGLDQQLLVGRVLDELGIG